MASKSGRLPPKAVGCQVVSKYGQAITNGQGHGHILLNIESSQLDRDQLDDQVSHLLYLFIANSSKTRQS
jgi:hypothetical protein